MIRIGKPPFEVLTDILRQHVDFIATRLKRSIKVIVHKFLMARGLTPETILAEGKCVHVITWGHFVARQTFGA